VTGPLLQVQAVVKNFGGLQVLRGVDLTLEAAELRCVIGPNGCGKTTLFNVISGAYAPTSGRILFAGQDITGRPPHQVSRLGIVRKLQVPGIYPSLTVSENLEVPLLRRRVHAGRSTPAGGGSGTRSELHALLERFGLERHAARPAGALAHGQKQWLEIAMLVAAHARLLLLDEPTAGMSAAETSATVELIRRIQSEHGVAVLVIEHDMSFVRQLGCPVSVMIRGTVRFAGSYAQIQAHPEVREAYLGQAAR
jgi:ABC-type branched-subunit amino acid transport system ATPase component